MLCEACGSKVGACVACGSEAGAPSALVGGVHAPLCPPCLGKWDAEAKTHASHAALYGSKVQGTTHNIAFVLEPEVRESHEAALRDHAKKWLTANRKK